MKKKITFSVLILLFGFVIFNQSCNYDSCKETIEYRYYRPVYKTKEQLRKIEVKAATALENPGKIYVYGDYLFINELYEGVHIFDNHDIDNPVNLAFISIVGNVDIAIKKDILYADNFIDLLSFDISNPAHPRYLNSVQNIFNTNYGDRAKYLVTYVPTDTFRTFDCTYPYYGDGRIYADGGAYSRNTTGTNSWNPPSTPSGVGGSMARFTIIHDWLYTVDNKNLNIFNISTPSSPQIKNKVNIGWGIETIFPYKNNLFIGSNTGMFIYNVAYPDNPVYKSQFKHARTCDPVFVVGDIAYVTLRSGNRCAGYTNQLDVIDIKNLIYPRLIKSYKMDNPHGLSVIGNKMILCEGEYGLKVLDIEDKKDITIKKNISDNHFYDVIGLSEQDIIIVGDNGLYQYKINGFDLIERSHIPILSK